MNPFLLCTLLFSVAVSGQASTIAGSSVQSYVSSAYMERSAAVSSFMATAAPSVSSQVASWKANHPSATAFAISTANASSKANLRTKMQSFFRKMKSDMKKNHSSRKSKRSEIHSKTSTMAVDDGSTSAPITSTASS